MLCSKPFVQGVLEYGCGQCKACRMNRRRVWTTRLMLENRLHETSAFLTLTYRDECLPEGGNLVKRHLQLFFKRLRERNSDRKLRYFAVGEYGGFGLRPHYHALVYGLDVRDHGPIRRGCRCMVCSSWGFGDCDVGTVTEQSAAYVAGYVMKDHEVPKHLVPEFRLMSLKPGIGGDSVFFLRDSVVDSDGVIRGCDVDVPVVLRSGGKRHPIGRYIRGKWRRLLGMGDKEPVLASAFRQLEVIAKEFPQGGTKDGWMKREGRRIQSNRRAAVLSQIAKSKKGLGL